MIEPATVSSNTRLPAGDRYKSDFLWPSINSFIKWLEAVGYESYDAYDIWGTNYGLFSRRRYYKSPLVGIPLIAPLVLVDLFCPSVRRLCVQKARYATADAQLGLAFLNLFQVTLEKSFLNKAIELSEDLLATSVPGFSGHCWGYPFNWQHNRGLWKKNTPFITVTPYVYELFVGLFDATGNPEFLEVAKSIAQFVFKDLLETPTSQDAAAGSYAPDDHSLVINASAYRAMVLFDAAHRFDLPEYEQAAQRNLNFILQNQKPNGAWLYAANNPAETFIDHFHTCFVLKSLYKINRRLQSPVVNRAIAKGFAFYRDNLIRPDGLPQPFAVKPRQQIVEHNMYDFAESITLGSFLWDQIPEAGTLAERLAQVLCRRYQLPDGHFVTRVHVFGFNHTFPFLRWPQAQLFYSLTNLLLAQRSAGLDAAANTLVDMKPKSDFGFEPTYAGVSETPADMTDNIVHAQKPMIADPLRERAIKIAVRTLPRMLVSAEGPFCLELTRDNSSTNFDKDKSWRYTIMCLLGVARAQEAGYSIAVDVKSIFQSTMASRSEFSAGDMGLLLWLAVRIGSPEASGLMTELIAKLSACDVDNLTGMEIAWIFVGLMTFSTGTGQKPGPGFFKMLDYFFAHRVAPSGFIYHLGRGFRRRFPNFATQIYSLHALSICARLGQDARCARHAVSLGQLLVRHQRPNGGWPWLYDAQKGTVVEPFELYSVHQHAMGPMALVELAEATGFDPAETLSKSLSWLDSNNELKYPMIDENTGLIYRSIRRRSPARHVLHYVRAVQSCAGVKPGAWLSESAGGLEINATCRPYELGWLLEAWCGRKQYGTFVSQKTNASVLR